MLSNKNIEKCVCLLMAVAVIFSLMLVPAGQNTAKESIGVSMGYERKIFSKGYLISIEVEIEDTEWNTILKEPEKKEYHPCNITINGERFQNVGIRAKGESSLEDVKWMGTSDRYSFAIKFDKYVEGQTYYGLDKLLLNNNYADITQMKDAVTYDMCSYLGLAAPLYSYARVSKNGKYFGCYLALESVGESFCKRNFGEELGGLYEPTEFGDEDGMDEGGNLGYIDDKTGSYSGIFGSGLIRFGGNKNSRNRVVEALKSVHVQSDIENHVDVDSILKYMAVQTIAVNLDSLTGSAGHNCFLYEKDGMIRLIPWDYNLAYGGYMDGGEDEEEEPEWEDGRCWEDEDFEEPTDEDYKARTDIYMNLPIDTPFTGNLDRRKFFMNLLENEKYRIKYHEYLSMLSVNYIQGGEFLDTVSSIQNEIDGIVCTEANSFFTKEQYQTAVKEFIKLLFKKCESVDGQLKGKIPSTRDGQQRDNSNLVSTDDIDIRLLGGE